MQFLNVVNSDSRLIPLENSCIQCCVTSPPYWSLRDYENKNDTGTDLGIGLEKSLDEYINNLVAVFREVHRVLRPDGTLWLNLGDCFAGGGNYRGINSDKTLSHKQRSNRGATGVSQSLSSKGKSCGLKHKQLVGLPWRVAFALQNDGWYLRSDIVWNKLGVMPESCKDRPTRSHEFIFLLTKNPRYFYDIEAVKEPCSSKSDFGKRRPSKSMPSSIGPHRVRLGNGSVGNDNGRNMRDVWTFSKANFKGHHFATFPSKLAEPCIKAGTSEKGCCTECNAPYRRIVEKDRIATRTGKNTKITGDRMVDGHRDPLRHITKTKTIGWKASCQCNNSVVPCVVLDPFCGAGTTGVVCKDLGRSFIGLELNLKYCRISTDRINGHYLAARQELTNSIHKNDDLFENIS